MYRHGKPVAVIASTADLAQLEALEEAQDVADARKALKEAAKHGTIPLEAVLKKYRLEHLLDAEASRSREAPGQIAAVATAEINARAACKAPQGQATALDHHAGVSRRRDASRRTSAGEAATTRHGDGGRDARRPCPQSASHRLQEAQGTSNLWRLRVGRYRVIYSILDDTLLIIIVKVGDSKRRVPMRPRVPPGRTESSALRTQYPPRPPRLRGKNPSSPSLRGVNTNSQFSVSSAPLWRVFSVAPWPAFSAAELKFGPRYAGARFFTDV